MLAAILLVFGCTRGQPTNLDVLWLPLNAAIEANAVTDEATRHVYADGTADVVFTLPASDRRQLTEQFIQHFEHAGWRQRAVASVNGSYQDTSFKMGWRRLCQCVIPSSPDGSPMAMPDAFEWVGEWEDSRGSRIGYSLKDEGTAFRGYASYVLKGMRR